MVRLCHMQQAYDRPTTQIVLCKSNLELALMTMVDVTKNVSTTIVAISNVE